MRSGGHCYLGTSAHTDLVIDLRDLRAVTSDPAAQTLTAQPGARLRRIYHESHQAGLSVPAGWCGDVGFGGHLLGGGLGYEARSHGLLCDRLISARLVDAEGRVRTLSAREEPDLYWATKGGGGGLGIITSATIAQHQPVAHVGVRAFGSFDRPIAAAIMARWMAWSPTVPNHTTLHLAANPLSDGRTFLRFSGLSGLDVETLREGLRTVSEGHLRLDENALPTGPMADLMGFYLRLDSQPLWRRTHTGLLQNALDTQTLHGLLDAMHSANAAQGGSGITLETIGGALGAVPAGATAFPHRGAAFMATLHLAGIDEEALKAGEGGLAAGREIVWRNAAARGYANYRDDGLDNPAEAYWGVNLPRLRTIKRTIDPEGVFSAPHSVPL
ncbi:MAG: FAD-binding oxidoreductase [Devosiaceae bacterium]|nr:FAD-binding oxidoreductase [Devosiaceae bacterium MH13]